MKAYSHLSAEERVRIDELRNREGLGVRQIASRIGRDKATVSRELRRGLWFASNENDSYRPYRPKRLKTGAWTSRPFYSAMTAQRKAETRARESRKPMRMAYEPLLAWVMDALRKGWTPERIEGRLKVEWPGDPRMRAGHECLYQWIYAKPQRALDLRQYLPRGKRHRTRAKGRRSKGPRIPMRVPIADKPKRVDSRREFGHFESDTVIGAAPSKRCIDTQVERRSRRLFARLIPDKSALATARAEYDIYKDIPAPVRIDRTWDNGTESSCHLLVDEALGMLTYFRGPVLLVPAGHEREPQRPDPPLPAQENELRRPDGRGPAGHRGRDQRHPHEGPGLGNAQRGLVPRTRQGNVKAKPLKAERCTYKLNSGSNVETIVLYILRYTGYQCKEVTTMVTLTLSKWGNAQGVRLPKDMREQVGMTDGSRVEATVKDGAIMLRPIHTNVRIIRVPRLSDVFCNRAKEYKVTEELAGPTVGEETL